jgi:hypothetical protein
MGFFSKTCAKTHLPIVHEGRGFPELSDVTVLFPDGRIIAGSYDGYGRVDGVDLCPDGYDERTWNRIKFVLTFAYDGEKYKDLGRSRDELGQGHFMADEFLRHCLEVKKFATFKDYKTAFQQLADW